MDKNKNLKIISNKIIKELETKIKDEIFLNSFIRDLEVYYTDDKEIHIGITVKYGIDLINEKYLSFFDETIKKIFLKKMEIVFFLKDKYDKYNNQPKRKKSSQINKNYSFNNFVESDYNKLCIKAVKNSIKSIAEFNPIFIYGKSGIGKTHLLHAIGNLAIDKNINVKLLIPNKFTNEVFIAIQGSNSDVEDLKNKYINNEILLIDDVQLLSSREKTIQILLEIFNHYVENRKQIIVMSDRTPNEMVGFEDRFITRFASGLTLEIKEPKIDDIILILKVKLAKNGFNIKNWNQDTIEYIAKNNQSSIRMLEGAIARIRFMFEANKNEKYTLSKVRNLFKNVKIEKRYITIDRVVEIVANYYKIPREKIFGSSRKTNITKARHISMKLIRDILKLPYKKIGEKFSKRNHATVMGGIEKITIQSKIDKSLREALKMLENKVLKVN